MNKTQTQELIIQRALVLSLVFTPRKKKKTFRVHCRCFHWYCCCLLVYLFFSPSSSFIQYIEQTQTETKPKSDNLMNVLVCALNMNKNRN